MYATAFTDVLESELSSSKQAQLRECCGYPRFYIVVEGWAFANNGGSVSYTVEIGLELEGRVMVFSREARYSDLLRLHESLKHDKVLERQLQKFPQKKVLGNLDVQFIRERCQSLQRYVSKLSHVNDMTKNKEFEKFFQFSKLKNLWEQRMQEYQNRLIEISYSSDSS